MAQLVADAQRSHFENFRHLFSETKNPLYLWEALAHAFVWEVEPPKWCMEQIKLLSWRLHELVAHASTNKYSGLAYKPDYQTTISHDRAAELAELAFGIDRPGYNAFRQIAADSEKISDAYLLDTAKLHDQMGNQIPNLTVETVVERIKKRRSVDSKHTVLRRVREGRNLQGPFRLPSTKPPK